MNYNEHSTVSPCVPAGWFGDQTLKAGAHINTEFDLENVSQLS